MLRIVCTLGCVFLAGLLAHSGPVVAQEPNAESASPEDESPLSTMQIDEIALELSHPASALASIRNDFEITTYKGDLSGASSQSSWRYVLRPSWPIRLSNGNNILLRASIPINADQPVYVADGVQYSAWMIRQFADVLPEDGYFKTGHDHLDDVGFDLAYSGVSDNGIIGLFGLKVVMPTNQDFSAARDQWLIGPELSLGKVTSWGVIGANANHLTNVSGENRHNSNTNMTSVDVFFAYGLGNGWQLISNPKIEYDWEAASDNKLFLPIGGGIAKTTRWGRMPLKMELEIFNYIVSPDAFGPNWLLTFSITPVIRGR
jgi:hypothetical protein